MSAPSPRPSPPRPDRLATSARIAAHRVLSGLAALHEGQHAEVLRPDPVPCRFSRAVGLGDALLLQALLAPVARVEPGRLRAAWEAREAIRPVGEVEQRVQSDESISAVVEACVGAGLRTVEAFAAAGAAVANVARHANGQLRVRQGQQWSRTLDTAAGAASRLAELRAELAPLRPLALPDLAAVEAEILLPHSLRTASADEALDALLRRAAAGFRRLLAETEPAPVGRPEVDDAVRFGAEQLVAVWRCHATAPPSLSRNAGGFVVWVETLNRIALAANGEAGLALLRSHTVEHVVAALLVAQRTPASEAASSH